MDGTYNLWIDTKVVKAFGGKHVNIELLYENTPTLHWFLTIREPGAQRYSDGTRMPKMLGAIDFTKNGPPRFGMRLRVWLWLRRYGLGSQIGAVWNAILSLHRVAMKSQADQREEWSAKGR